MDKNTLLHYNMDVYFETITWGDLYNYNSSKEGFVVKRYVIVVGKRNPSSDTFCMLMTQTERCMDSRLPDVAHPSHKNHSHLNRFLHSCTTGLLRYFQYEDRASCWVGDSRAVSLSVVVALCAGLLVVFKHCKREEALQQGPCSGY